MTGPSFKNLNYIYIFREYAVKLFVTIMPYSFYTKGDISKKTLMQLQELGSTAMQCRSQKQKVAGSNPDKCYPHKTSYIP